jgi:small subunit ribosomal protein S17
MNSHKREIQGVVVKRSGDKTVSVLVTRKVLHPKYHKTVKRFKKYLVHDEKNEVNVTVRNLGIQSRPQNQRNLIWGILTATLAGLLL